jgi:hypothetical protein
VFAVSFFLVPQLLIRPPCPPLPAASLCLRLALALDLHSEKKTKHWKLAHMLTDGISASEWIAEMIPEFIDTTGQQPINIELAPFLRVS